MCLDVQRQSLADCQALHDHARLDARWLADMQHGTNDFGRERRRVSNDAFVDTRVFPRRVLDVEERARCPGNLNAILDPLIRQRWLRRHVAQ